jgi:hypothetical protein
MVLCHSAGGALHFSLFPWLVSLGSEGPVGLSSQQTTWPERWAANVAEASFVEVRDVQVASWPLPPFSSYFFFLFFDSTGP